MPDNPTDCKRCQRYYVEAPILDSGYWLARCMNLHNIRRWRTREPATITPPEWCHRRAKEASS